MKIMIAATIALFCMSASAAGTKAQPPMDAKKQEMMRKWMEFSTPGSSHKVLESMVGEWNATSKMWESMNGAPMESTGKSSMKMIMGGRYLEQNFSGMAMGQPFEGRGFMGYNNLEKRYETMWIDNMATAMMHGTGTWDSKSKILKDSGQFSCPMAETKQRTYRTEFKVVNKDTLVFTMWAPEIETGKDFKNMEITYKRAK